jgi:cell division protein FtsZ
MVLGVGGAGNNIISRLLDMRISGTKYIALNAGLPHLNISQAHEKILIGEKMTKGLEAGGFPVLGKSAIEESQKTVEELCKGVDIVFITTCLRGGTETGAAPLVAEIARKSGALTVGVVTTPFRVKRGRIRIASEALIEMRRNCDMLVIIENKLIQFVPLLSINEAFEVTDQALANMIKSIIETISTPSLINLDFTDFKTIVKRGGVAIMGVGESDAPNRVEEAVKNALRSSFLDVDYSEATGALIHVSGDNQMTIEEANQVGEIITKMMNEEALVILGARVNPDLAGVLKVTLVVTGINSPYIYSGFGDIVPNLFNLEPYAGPERELNIGFNLYQME